jgi:hypothetical protein
MLFETLETSLFSRPVVGPHPDEIERWTVCATRMRERNREASRCGAMREKNVRPSRMQGPLFKEDECHPEKDVVCHPKRTGRSLS